MKQRAIGILNRLLISNNPISKKILAKEYQVSVRTIRNDVNEINKLLIENYLPEVVYKRNEGYLLILSSNEVLLIKEFIKEDNEQETFFGKNSRLLDLLLSVALDLDNEKIILSKKEKEYDVSKNSLDDDMLRLRKFIEKYHLNISSMSMEDFQILI